MWYDGKNFVCEKWSAKTYCKRGVGAAKHQLRCHPEVKRLGNLQVVENSPADHKSIEVQATEPIKLAAETSPGVKVDRVQEALKADITEFNNRFRAKSAGFYKPRIYATESVDGVEERSPKCAECFDDGFFEEESGFIRICHCRSEPKLSCQSVQSVIEQAAKNLPDSRSKTSTAHQLLELFKSSAHIIEDFPGVKTEGEVSQSAITPVLQNRIEEDPDLNPILTGVALSDTFLARYSPPQPQNIRFRSDADGQLSLLDFEVQSEPEPPDPDDFESLDAFREAIALWDAQNPEPPAVSLDSMCEWAPCPEEWYEPKAEILPLKASSTIELPEQSSVIELLIADESSITCNFFIPTFDAWCDRFNRSDELPDTGSYARLPKPKPPSFPATALGQAHTKRSSNPAQTQPKLIPNSFQTHTYCIVAGSSTQPARSPPGGDAGF